MFSLRHTLLSLVAAGALSVGVVGCANQHNAAIPPTATSVASGTDRVTYAAPSNGKFYVLDARDNKLVWSGDARKGEVLAVDGSMDKVLLDSRIVREEGLHRGNLYRIYFEPRETVTDKVTVERRELNR